MQIMGRNFADGELTVSEKERRAEISDVARTLHMNGFRLIPIHRVRDDGTCSCGNPECRDSIGKHPMEVKWTKVGSDRPKDLRWWREVELLEDKTDWEPRANLGIVTGEPSGIFVVDIDPGSGGDVRFQQLVDEHSHEPFPNTMIVETGSGGRHYYFRWPGHAVINSKPWGKASGIDIRGDGGMVVAPPSISGKGPYSFVGPVWHASRIPEAPKWILDRLGEIFHRNLGHPVDDVPAVPDHVISKYVLSAVSKEAAKMRGAPRGDRNNTLNSCALSLGTLGAHGLLAEEVAFNALSEAALSAGLGSHEIRVTFSSGWRAGLLKPRDLRGVGELTRPGEQKPSWDEFGLGDRLVIYFGDILRWVREWQKWAICLDGVWHRCDDSEPQKLAQDVIRMLERTEGPLYPDEVVPDEEGGDFNPSKGFREWVRKQRTHAKVTAMVNIARDRPAIRISAAHFDENPFWLNCRNGVYDADEDTLLRHDPEFLLTMQAGVAYRPDATCPRWDDFLERVQPDPAYRDYLYRIWGYSLTADMGDRAFFMHHGDGANGKSVANSVISAVLGSYAQTVPVRTFEQVSGANDQIPADVARMEGKRYLAASETRAGRRLNDALLKLLSGGDTIAARFLYREFFEFKPVGKIHIISNHLMKVPNDPSIASRLHLMPWSVVIPDKDRDKHLAIQIFRKEGSGVLNRLLAGMRDWRQLNSLGEPAEAAEHRREFMESQDWRFRFTADYCNVVDAKVAVGRSSGELYAAFEIYWRHNESDKSARPNINEFVHGLKSAGHAHRKTTLHGNSWTGFPELEVKPFAGQ